MRYYLDTEFNGFGGGELLSLALVNTYGDNLYVVVDPPKHLEPWVVQNVMPVVDAVPDHVQITRCAPGSIAYLVADFFADHGVPYIITDRPDDVRYLCQAIVTGPGLMAPIPRLQFDIVRVDSYPTTLPGAVQHNAWWDAMALRHRLVGGLI